MISSLALAYALSTPAQAQQEACQGTFLVEEWREGMDAVDRALSDGKGGLAQKILDQIYEALRCAAERVDPDDVGRFAQQMSVSAFSAQDFDDATRWAQLANATLGADSWPAELPRTDAYRQMQVGLAEPQVSGPEGRGLAVPNKGAFLIDGRLALRAEAAVSVPHFIQSADKSGQVLWARWIDGAAFPDELLGDSGVAAVPNWYVDPDAEERVKQPVGIIETAPTPASDSDEAPQCPWRAVKNASVEASAVTINKTVYNVRSDVAQMGFLDILYSCEEFEAAGRFQKWRAARAINPFEGSMDRDAMIKALLAD